MGAVFGVDVNGGDRDEDHYDEGEEDGLGILLSGVLVFCGLVP